MAASKRLTMTALTLLKPSTTRARSLSTIASSPLLANSRAKLPLVDNNVVVPFNFSTAALSRHFHASFFPGVYHSSSLIDKLEFTRMEWEGIASLIFEARVNYGVVETEDFMKILVEKKNGLAGRILSKAGLDNTSILQAIHDFISQKQPKVSRDTSALKVGEHLNLLLENSIKHRNDMKDEFVSVEHFILAFCMDGRFGQKLLTDLGLSEKDLGDAIDAVRVSLRRELNEHWGIEKELKNRIRTLKEEIDRVNVEIESADRAATLASLGRQLEEAEKNLAETVSKWRGTHFEDTLHQGVVGQNMAVRAVADAIRRSRAGLSGPNRPIASFMFTGPKGVGKKTLANTLADYLFNKEETVDDYLYNTVVRIDMSEYTGENAASRLVVALSYRDKEVLVQLTEFVRHRPYCVILFEEIEKAHPDVLSVLSQILDSGRITDCQGKTVCFKNTVIIMTSKIGSHLLPDTTLSSNTQEVIYGNMRKQVLDLARETFRPELMNCIDECAVFKPLDASEIRNLAEIWMRRWEQDFKREKVELQYTEEAIDVVGRLFYDPNLAEEISLSPIILRKHFMNRSGKWLEAVWMHELKLVKVDVTSNLCLGVLHCKNLPTHYQIDFGTSETGLETCRELWRHPWLECSWIHGTRQLTDFFTRPKGRKDAHAEIMWEMRRSAEEASQYCRRYTLSRNLSLSILQYLQSDEQKRIEILQCIRS